MWVMHPDGGFYSAVEDRADPNVLVVRARARSDLVALQKFISEFEEPGKVVKGGGTDYPFRMRMSRGAWDHALVQMAERIDYTNFKNAVLQRQGQERAHVYARIWGALLALEPRERVRRRVRDLFEGVRFGE
jgi:hypothetical protein